MSKSKATLLATLVLFLLAVPIIAACSKSATTTTTVAPATTTTAPKTTTTTSVTTTTITTAPKPTTTALTPLPSIIGLVTTAGSGTGITATAVMDILSKQLGVKIAIQALGNKVDSMTLLKSGQVQLYASSTTTTLDPKNGAGDFAKAGWGPQPLRMIAEGTGRSWGFYTSKKTGITTFEQIKGKRVTFFPADATRNNTIESAFKAHGFTWADVQKVSFDSADAAQQGLLDGTIDVAFTGFPTAKMVEVDATLGCVVIPFTDTPQMAAIFHSLLPHDLVMVKKGAFVGVTQDMLLPASVDQIISYNTLGDDFAYQIAKGLWDANAQIIANTASKDWTKANAVMIPTSAPFHPGAIRFYKEVGVWSAAHDKWQADALQAEKDKIAAFKPAS